MYNKSHTLILISACLCFYSCDPAKVLSIKTSAKENTSVTIYGNRSFLPKTPAGLDTKVIMTFSGSSNLKDTSFHYGIGYWSDESIADITANIDSIVFNNRTGTVSLHTKEDIKTYLLNHRTGYGKSRLTIKAE